MQTQSRWTSRLQRKYIPPNHWVQLCHDTYSRRVSAGQSRRARSDPLSELQELYLHSNPLLSGTIPSELRALAATPRSL